MGVIQGAFLSKKSAPVGKIREFFS